ncbi:MAG: glycoside hydrolase family 3 C-terminal domain-containing protein [Firmicutes bacterium]|nr:glycoside hydrolase family 3 C-terminal domain-containing protein [Bacillota bacterium]
MKKLLVGIILFLTTFSTACAVTSATTTTSTTDTTTSSETTQTTTQTTTSNTTTTNTTTTSFLTDTAPVNYEGSYCDELVVDYDYIDNLLASLTLEEKVGQMMQAEKNGVSNNDVTNYNLGSILSGGGSAPSTNDAYNWYLMYKGFQDAARNSSSEIPIIYGLDAVHGNNNVYRATMFPHNIGLGAANDPDLMERIGLITAREIRVTGMNYTFAPMIGVVQDISWGRTYESLSESADLVAGLTGAYIDGLQNYCIGASAKHFVADGGTDGGHDQGNAIMTEEEVRAIHLVPYYDAIEAGVYTIMISYSSINGEKMHASEYWIQDVLKDEMGFDGFVISDYEAIHQLPGDYYAQLVSSINAGVDMLMEPWSWKDAITNIIAAVGAGDISMNRIDDAVRRILIIKYKMGLFSEDFYDESTQTYYRLSYSEGFSTDENKAVAREAVRESLVLLKNENNALPLSKDQDVAVIGEGAVNIGIQCGGWTIGWQGDDNRSLTPGTTILAGMREAVSGTNGTVVQDIYEADTVVVVLSENPYAEYYGDNDTLTLTGPTATSTNADVLEQVLYAKSEGKKVVALILAGRPLILGQYEQFFDAIVMAWLPGTEAGHGIADVLYGDYDFTGKLPVTWPKNSTGIGMNINSVNYNPDVVLYPFGTGLSYKEENPWT